MLISYHIVLSDSPLVADAVAMFPIPVDLFKVASDKSLNIPPQAWVKYSTLPVMKEV